MTTRPSAGLRSSYVEYLPPPLQSDAFMGRFLLIIERVVAPIEHTIDNVADYFDPSVTPDAYLPWLAGWVGQELDEHWPRERWRTLIARAAVLHRWRGTRRALRERVSLYVGRPPLVVENFSGMRIGQDAALGLNTTLGEPRPNSIAVTVVADDRDAIDEAALRRVIQYELPAAVTYTLDIRALHEIAHPGSDR